MLGLRSLYDIIMKKESTARGGSANIRILRNLLRLLMDAEKPRKNSGASQRKKE